MTVLDFLKFKQEKKKISMITCYDSTFSQIVDSSDVDCILIGDSCSNVMHGEESKIPAKMEWLEEHTRSVRSKTKKFIVSDMPFLSTRKGFAHAVDCAGRLLVSGANAVKIEGVYGQEEILKSIILSGIPVIAHLGLTPQFFQAFGGHRMQGKTEEAAEKIIYEAKKAEELGCFAVLVECIPQTLAKKITDLLSVPVIGIGSGVDVDGQVLVLQDMLGLSTFKPFFVRHYLNGAELVKNALNSFNSDVKTLNFPSGSESK